MKIVIVLIALFAISLAWEDKAWTRKVVIDDQRTFDSVECSLFTINGEQQDNIPFKSNYCADLNDAEMKDLPNFDNETIVCPCFPDTANINQTTFQELVDSHRVAFMVKGRYGDEIECGKYEIPEGKFAHGLNITVNGYFYKPFWMGLETTAIDNCKVDVILGDAELQAGVPFANNWIISGAATMTISVAVLMVSLFL